jgi:hypothetical protein
LIAGPLTSAASATAIDPHATHELFVLNYGVFAALRNSILDRHRIFRPTNYVASPHQSIEIYLDVQISNIAPEITGRS